MDKLAYCLGTNIVMMFSYIISKYPHTYIYDYATIVMTLFFIHRYYTFWYNGWHMYLADFCYFANFMMYGFIHFAP